MEICIAVADWARGPMTSVLGVPGGEGTDAKRRRRPRPGPDRHRDRRDLRERTVLKGLRDRRYRRVSPTGSTARSTGCGRGAGMVAGWG
ncbi:hypothetical protein C4B68_17190 [Streptomyces dengpaensis]|uniref:Uncharacterized protein n=1 Tax=Streptomyces dengpaensis TaxID=2049881 RepID=A0ABN5IDG9_9ACTN|nr:hypothetical protein C4B68_17190 [Streptomyces dengpaensis]PIB09177.1 hypothetical protein B1C81_11330 [Streptomyces sp. HG99]